MTFPNKQNLTICFAHPAYQLAATFAQRQTGVNHFQVWQRDRLDERIKEADILVASFYWDNNFLDSPRLKYVQAVSAGINQFDTPRFQQSNTRLANAAGVNAHAVAEHALAHILSFSRLMHTSRDYQHQRHYRGMISDLSQRESELGGKTLLIVGLGTIGRRLAKLAKVFDMHIIATKRTPNANTGQADEVHPPDKLHQLLPRADYIALTCPLTPETKNLIDAHALTQIKPSAHLINIARGRVVHEPALINALQKNHIAGAGLDCFWDEPLPQDSPLWAMENVIITPHTGGETRQYETRISDILLENLNRLWRGETTLYNQIV